MTDLERIRGIRRILQLRALWDGDIDRHLDALEASAIEARRAATPKSDAVEDESATRKGTPK